PEGSAQPAVIGTSDDRGADKRDPLSHSLGALAAQPDMPTSSVPCPVGIGSALRGSRRQHYFVVPLPADKQHAVFGLDSGSGVDAKPSVKRIAVQVRRGVS